jgi:hypothetical protein
MGMELSISRSLIEAHDGTLHFNSKPGKGTTFYFIPFALQISAHPLPRPPGEGWGEGIKKPKFEVR